jgi:hypothetical protein
MEPRNGLKVLPTPAKATILRLAREGIFFSIKKKVRIHITVTGRAKDKNPALAA